MKTNQISYEKANELLRYNASTGLLHWNTPSRYRAACAVGIANKNGYLKFVIGRKSYRVHSVAYLLYYGEFARNQIYHINGNRSDNRICNLRVAPKQNNQ